MLPELGHFALILAAFVALSQLHPLLAHRAAALQFGLCAAAVAALFTGFALSDFTMVTVAEHSHTMLPAARRLAGPFYGFEGQLTIAAFAASSVSLALALKGFNPALLRLSGLAAAVVIAAALSAQPFERIYPPPFDGVSYDPLAVTEDGP